MAAMRSPRDFDSLNTPKMLTTPVITSKDDLLCTPTLTTPRTGDGWNLFSPVRLSSTSSSPSGGGREIREPPADLPLDSSIGLSSPHDGVLAKRRKLKQQSSGHSRSIESDSNSCDTPDSNQPKDLTTNQKKRGDERSHDTLSSRLIRGREEYHEGRRPPNGDPPEAEDKPDVSTPTDLTVERKYRRDSSPGATPWDHIDSVRDRVGNVAISSSPKYFKHPRNLPDSVKAKDSCSDLPQSYHPSPLAVPSPNWTAISAFMTSEGLALKTPKVLDNFVFDVLPPNTPNTPKDHRHHVLPHHLTSRDKSPENVYDRLSYVGGGGGGDRSSLAPPTSTATINTSSSGGGGESAPRQRQTGGESRGVTFASQPTSIRGCLEVSSPDGAAGGGSSSPSPPSPHPPPPPYPEDLSVNRHKSTDELVIPKREVLDDPCDRPNSASPRLGYVKEEPRDFPCIPPGFPPYYLHPGITPQSMYGRQPHQQQQVELMRHRHQLSPPASPPRLHSFYQQNHRQFYNGSDGGGGGPFNGRSGNILYNGGGGSGGGGGGGNGGDTAVTATLNGLQPLVNTSSHHHYAAAAAAAAAAAVNSSAAAAAVAAAAAAAAAASSSGSSSSPSPSPYHMWHTSGGGEQQQQQQGPPLTTSAGNTHLTHPHAAAPPPPSHHGHLQGWSLPPDSGHHNHGSHVAAAYLKEADGLLPLKTEGRGRLSTESPEPHHHHHHPHHHHHHLQHQQQQQQHHLHQQQQQSSKKGGRKTKVEDCGDLVGEDGLDNLGQPPKKRGKGKTKAKEQGGPKRVFICPHCQRSYDWNYNLNRHLKYECGKENAFMCSKCGRRFPHKQNCVYHLKRKHKIMCDTVDQYVSAGLVIYQGSDPRGAGVGGGSLTPHHLQVKGEHPSPPGGGDSSMAYSPDIQDHSPTPSHHSN